MKATNVSSSTLHGCQSIVDLKSTAQGRLLENGTLTVAEAMGYVLSLPAASTLIVGCKTPAEVDENAEIAREFVGFTDERMKELESRTQENAADYTYYKKAASIGLRRA
jgi:aryl-alcohol dehydrogenase-like predicted oxidoreductase